jgi:membrane-associated phospholipid phosphatase
MSLIESYTSRQTLVDDWLSNRGWVMTSLFVFQLIVVYGLIQVFITDGLIPRIFLDSIIPIVPIFLVPYVLYYPLLLLPFWVAYKRDQNSDHQRYLFAVGTAFFLAATVCNVIFMLFPTEIIRPTVSGSGLMSEALRFVHKVDGSVALFPSGHVTYSLLAALTTTHLDERLAVVVWPTALLILPATVLIKQHYILDVLGGVLVALITYYAFFRPLIVKSQK